MVGNSTYAHIGRLPNPDNDARDMSAVLRRLGFEVTTELDADRVELTEALRRFTRRLGTHPHPGWRRPTCGRCRGWFPTGGTAWSSP